MTHDVIELREEPHRVVAVCACGHEAEGPNEDTARKRHLPHKWIQEAREPLKGGDE